MKITIEELRPGEEEEIIIRAASLDPELIRVLNKFRDNKAGDKITCFDHEKMRQMPINEIIYFEAVDEHVFAYFDREVLEVKSKLYEIEEMTVGTDFFRAGRSVIINLSKVKHFSPGFNARYEAMMYNGERVMISRSFVPELKRRLGVK